MEKMGFGVFSPYSVPDDGIAVHRTRRNKAGGIDDT